MRMMLKVSIPVEAGNEGVKDGTLAKTFMGFIEQHKTEAAYFVAEGGKRTAYFFFDLKDLSSIPSVAEPFFTNLNAALVRGGGRGCRRAPLVRRADGAIPFAAHESATLPTCP